MVQRIGTSRTKTRSKLKKNIREKGKLSLKRYFQSFKEGDKVLLKAEPAVQKGMYFPRFHGKVGIILSQAGECYNVEIKDKNKTKTLIIHPIHLRGVNR